jgi:hypothetical protein
MALVERLMGPPDEPHEAKKIAVHHCAAPCYDTPALVPTRLGL